MSTRPQNDVKERWAAVRQATYAIEAIKEVSLSRRPPVSDSERDATHVGDAAEVEEPIEESSAGEHGIEWVRTCTRCSKQRCDSRMRISQSFRGP